MALAYPCLEVISSCCIAAAAAARHFKARDGLSSDGLALWLRSRAQALACAPLQLALQLPLQVPMLDSEVVTAQQQRSTDALANVKGTDGPLMMA